MERFWGRLKNQLVRRQRYATRASARAAIQEYIERFYKRRRRHSHPGNVPPALFAENFANNNRLFGQKNAAIATTMPAVAEATEPHSNQRRFVSTVIAASVMAI